MTHPCTKIYKFNGMVCLVRIQTETAFNQDRNEQLIFFNNIRGSLNKFPDFIHTGTFIDSTHMKL